MLLIKSLNSKFILLFLLLFFIINSNYCFASILNIETPAKQVVIYDHEIDKVLYEKNSNSFMKPASMAKVMTAYIVFDSLQMGL